MRSQKPFSHSTYLSLKNLLAETKKKSDFQRVQCVWLRAEFGMDAAEVARITNLTAGTVRKIWSNFLRHGEKTLIGRGRGGRRNYYLSIEEERLFLAPFLKKAEGRNPLIVSKVKKAFEELTGKGTHKSTIYRLLARHGWKKKPIRIPAEENSYQYKAGIKDNRSEGYSPAISPEWTDR
jgi:transposase